MLYSDIKTQDKEILRVKNQDKIIWEGMPNPFIIDKTNFRKYITSFSDTRKKTSFHNGEMVSTNDIKLKRVPRIKNIEFTSGIIDTEIAVTFVCQEINYLKTFSVLPTKGDFFETSDMIIKTTKNDLINKINSNLHREWVIYFSLYENGDTPENHIKALSFYEVKLRIDFY